MLYITVPDMGLVGKIAWIGTCWALGVKGSCVWERLVFFMVPIPLIRLRLSSSSPCPRPCACMTTNKKRHCWFYVSDFADECAEVWYFRATVKALTWRKIWSKDSKWNSQLKASQGDENSYNAIQRHFGYFKTLFHLFKKYFYNPIWLLILKWWFEDWVKCCFFIY